MVQVSDWVLVAAHPEQQHNDATEIAAVVTAINTGDFAGTVEVTAFPAGLAPRPLSGVMVVDNRAAADELLDEHLPHLVGASGNGRIKEPTRHDVTYWVQVAWPAAAGPGEPAPTGPDTGEPAAAAGAKRTRK